MPKGRPSKESLLSRVLEMYSFSSKRKSELVEGDRFLDTDGSLRKLAAKGFHEGGVFFSYEGDPQIHMMSEDVPVLVVISKEKEAPAQPPKRRGRPPKVKPVEDLQE